MKPKEIIRNLFLIWALITSTSFCYASTNGSVSGKEFDKIKTEVKDVVNTLITGCEQANFDIAAAVFDNSPDFRYILNGNIFGYDDMLKGVNSMFKTMIDQKYTFLDEKYTILDKWTVLYTAKAQCTMNFKDGHSTVSDPEAMFMLFKKAGDKWKIIYAVESTVDKIIEKKNAENLNQIELFKQRITGVWKCETGKDTIFTWDCKDNGNAFEADSWYESNGKRFWKSKSVIVYDKNSDKYIWTRVFNKGYTDAYVWWFTSPDVLESVPVNNITNPSSANFSMRFEYLSPNSLKQIVTVDKKVVDTFNVQRIDRNEQNDPPLTEMNQRELLKLFSGSWKGELGKDTFEIWNNKITDNSLEINYKDITKGKVVSEGRTFFIYDRDTHKFIGSKISKMKDPYSVIMWFTSKNTVEIIKFKDVNNTPENCSVRVLLDLTNPNKIIRTFIGEGLSPLVTNYNRIN
nr:nuclear transport factor 2 family protein [uncultured Bacteroides sp.]